MNVLIKYKTKFDLNHSGNIKEKMILSLKSRVEAAYFFGSFAQGKARSDSDLDMILIKNTSLPFTKRGEEFLDLFDIFPRIDLLIYTPTEFESQLKQEFGFWKSVKQSLVKIL